MKIEVKNLSCVYNKGTDQEIRALDDVSFVIESGSVTGIIGQTGSGKSTLVQHLNGLMKAPAGTVVLGDVELGRSGVRMADIRKKVGLVFQYPEYQLFEETIAEDIAFGPRNMGLSAEEIEERVREAMALTGMDYDTFAQRSPFELSGGQKRRVAIAGVIAMRPEVLILDEPAAGLDPASHRDLMEMIRRFHTEQGCTILLVSHNMNDVAEYCDHVLVMDKGKMVFSGTPEEFFSGSSCLTEVGLGLPSGAELMQILKAKGASAVPAEGVLTAGEATEAVWLWLNTSLEKNGQGGTGNA